MEVFLEFILHLLLEILKLFFELILYLVAEIFVSYYLIRFFYITGAFLICLVSLGQFKVAPYSLNKSTYCKINAYKNSVYPLRQKVYISKNFAILVGLISWVITIVGIVIKLPEFNR